MEQFNRANPGTTQQIRATSMYSNGSTEKSADWDYETSTDSSSSRAVSLKPSYMNSVPTRKPVIPKIAPSRQNGTSGATQPVQAPAVKGLLLLAVAALPHPSTVSYLEMMLKRGSYSKIIVIGNTEQETELKQLKMSLYALLGKLSLEVGIHLDLQNSLNESEISSAVSNAVQTGDKIHGVLCTPAYEGHSSFGMDIMTLDESQLESHWKTSVAFLHNVARSAIPNFRSENRTQRLVTGLFLVTELPESSSTSLLYRATCDSLIALLADATAANGPTVAYAEKVLIPELELEHVKRNGKMDRTTRAGPRDTDVGDYAPPESPTKLWNMWALQDELGAVD